MGHVEYSIRFGHVKWVLFVCYLWEAFLLGCAMCLGSGPSFLWIWVLGLSTCIYGGVLREGSGFRSTRYTWRVICVPTWRLPSRDTHRDGTHFRSGCHLGSGRCYDTSGLLGQTASLVFPDILLPSCLHRLELAMGGLQWNGCIGCGACYRAFIWLFVDIRERTCPAPHWPPLFLVLHRGVGWHWVNTCWIAWSLGDPDRHCLRALGMREIPMFLPFHIV